MAISNSGTFELSLTFRGESETSDAFVSGKSPFSVGELGVGSSFSSGDSIPICFLISETIQYSLNYYFHLLLIYF